MRKLFLIIMALMACTLGLQAQTITYTGTVIDADNDEPLVGATVMPVGGGQGVATDIDGRFSLTVPSNVHKVRITYVGYTEQTVMLKNRMTIKLHSSATNLDDVVVVAYGTATKESLTGSVSVVNSKEIEKRPVTTVTAALEGNAPGVQVYNATGSPGSDPSILIRGINTVNGTTRPLYVVDGVIFEGGLSDINPNDVESMSVLKDAASCALYGAKGANGVILINTKRAKDVGNVAVTLSIKQGMYTRGLPFYDRVNQTEFMETLLRAGANGIISGDPSISMTDAITAAKQSFYNDNKIVNIYGMEAKNIFDDNGKMRSGVSPLAGYTDLDWWDAMARTGYRQEYNINATSATERSNVFASVSYLKEDGYMKNTQFERFNGRVNANFNPVSYFRFGANIMASYEQSFGNQFSDGSMANPFGQVNNAPALPYYQHDENGNIVYDVNGKPVWNTDENYPATQYNIGYLMENDFQRYNGLMVDASVYGTAVLPYGFELTVRGNMWRDHGTQTQFGNENVGDAKGSIGGRLGVQNWRSYSHSFFQQLNWSHNYGIHHVDVLLDHENYNRSFERNTVNNTGIIRQGIYTLSNFAKNESYYSYAWGVRSESYLGRLRYNYDEKYFGEASIRRDGSSRFAKDCRWGTFWSVGASWILSSEEFFKQINWVNYLKLRTAYGTVGTDAAAGYYAYWDTFDQIDYNPNGAALWYPGQIANTQVKWESTNTFDLGIEGTLFDNRLNFSIGYFFKDNADLLYNVPNAPSVGQQWGDNAVLTSVLKNMGTMRNYGWELSFNGDIIRNKDWRWTASVDATFIKNTVKSIPNHQNVYGNPALIEGKSRYEMYTYHFAGVDQLTGRSLYAIDFEGAHEWETRDPETNLWVWEPNGAKEKYDTNLQKAKDAGQLVEIDGKYYTMDTAYATKRFLGSTLPTVYGSFGTNLSWKGINLGLLFTYTLGGKIYDSNYLSLMSSMTSTSAHTFHKDILNSWTQAPAGMTEDSPNRLDPNGIPQLNSTNQSNYNNAASDRWLTSASFLQLKNLNVSYDFPSKWVNALKLSKLNLGCYIDNVFTKTSRKGINPQYNYSGGQGNTFVTSRVFSFQLTAGF